MILKDQPSGSDKVNNIYNQLHKLYPEETMNETDLSDDNIK